MVFNDKKFMLTTQAAQKLYDIAEKQPIFDFHCHLDPKDIFEDKVYDDIVDLWLGGDHYKWRLMRANGIGENEITGSASNLDKFKAWAKTLGRAFGNPLYHWSHLELSRVFGITDVLTETNAEAIYHQMNQYIKENQLSPRKLIKAANVRFIGTTDHPLDSLEWHQKLAVDPHFDTIVAPTFRPDEAYVDHRRFSGFVKELAKITSREINSFSSFMDAMGDRIAYFAEHGCRASDISFGEISFELATETELDSILRDALMNESLTSKQTKQWQTAVFSALCGLYREHGIVAQVHFGAIRNNNSAVFEALGPDVGVDSIGDQVALASSLNQLLNHLSQTGQLPKMIWFNLNPSYNILLANTLMNFQTNEDGIQGKLQFGAGWWFADTKLGMIDQMNAYAEQGMLANFIGMLTDSRSFLSYQRHDYFRRILCDYVGKWVESEEVPADYDALGKLITDICYDNAQTFFEK